MPGAQKPAQTFDEFETFNFQTANILLLEQGGSGLDILMQIFAGFGTRNCYKAMSVAEAMGVAQRSMLDLIMVDPMLKGSDGHEFVRWLRRSGLDPNRSAPVVMASSNGSSHAVKQARDCGANYYLLKPVQPKILFDRIVRIAREARSFIVAENYVGPNRRHKNEGPAPQFGPRRSTDRTDALGEPAEANLSQDAIDQLLKPQKVSL